MPRPTEYKELTYPQLRSLCETARLQGMSAAAAALGVAQPTVWKQIHCLEQNLGELLPCVAEYERQFPQVRLVLRQVATRQGVMAQVESGDADIGLCSYRPAELPREIHLEPLYELELVLLVRHKRGSHGGSALSNRNGGFTLQTFPPDDGVVAGTYKVMIIRSLVPQNPDPGSPESKVPQRAKLLIPNKYTDANTSGLEVVVPDSGKTDIKLQLTG